MRYTARCPLRIDLAGYWTALPGFAQREGGAMLSIAIRPYALGQIARPTTHRGLLHALRGNRHYVSYTLDVPPGAGLAASAAQTVLWVTLVKTVVANVSDRVEVAGIAHRLEELLESSAHRADPYACALGGVSFVRLGADVHAETLPLPPSFLEDLESRLLLVYTGPAEQDRVLSAHLDERVRAGDTEVVHELSRMREQAFEMQKAVLARDVDAVIAAVGDQWTAQKHLAGDIAATGVDTILEFARRRGAAAGKVCGGGGTLLLAVAPDRRDSLRAALSTRNLQIIDFSFDSYGVHLSRG